MDILDIPRGCDRLSLSIGDCYIYPLEPDVLREQLRDRANEPVEVRARVLAATFLSMEEAKTVKEDVVPLPADRRDAMTDDDAIAIGEALRAQKGQWAFRFTKRAPPELAAKQPAETGWEFLDRVIKEFVAADEEKVRELNRKLMAPFSNWEDDTRKAFERLNLSEQSLDRALGRGRVFEDPLASHHERIRQERDEELKVARSSAEMLRALSAAATQFMSDLARREDQANAQFKRSLRVALVSLIVSVVIGILALAVSIAAYRQDSETGKAGDEQTRVRAEQEAARAARQDAASQEQARLLREVVQQLSKLQASPAAQKASQGK